MDALDLSADAVGVLMRLHGVGGFGHSEVPDDRITSLMDELADEEWEKVIE